MVEAAMQQEKPSYFGLGPKMIRPAVLVALVGGVAAWLEPEVFAFPTGFLQPLRGLLGGMCIFAGLWLWLWALKRMVPAVRSGQLDTEGPFALVRHPMYSAWIVFLFPGLALLTGAWMLLLSAVVAWIGFNKWVDAEEQILIDRFGPAYEHYRQKVRSLFPIPKE